MCLATGRILKPTTKKVHHLVDYPIRSVVAAVVVVVNRAMASTKVGMLVAPVLPAHPAKLVPASTRHMVAPTVPFDDGGADGTILHVAAPFQLPRIKGPVRIARIVLFDIGGTGNS